MKNRLTRAVTFLQTLVILGICTAPAEATIWTAIDYPGAGNTYAFGIDGTSVVGDWWTADFSAGPFGFNYDGGAWSPRQYPGSSWTQPNDVDGSQLVGAYSDGSVHGFRYDGTSWHPLDYPGANQTHAHGIDSSKVVGSYGTLGASHGFVYDGASWTTLDFPDARSTEAHGISGSQIVGLYADTAFVFHGFLRNGTTWTTLDYPGADSTNAHRIDGSNIVGSYFKNEAFHGFVFDGVNWTTLDYPGAMYTEVYGIDGSKVVGIYTEASGTQHGFVATVSDSDTFASVGDYNEDGFVDAADYTVWRHGLGSIYTPAHYEVWRNHFGQAISVGSGIADDGLNNGAVPEPTTLWMLFSGILMLCARRRTHIPSRLSTAYSLFSRTHRRFVTYWLNPGDWAARVVTLIAVYSLAWSNSASAQNSVWIGGSGFVWSTPANWQSGLVPNASRDAFVNNGGTANITFTGAAQARSLTLGENVGQSGTVGVFVGNSLTTGINGIKVGVGGTGTFAVSGGGVVNSGDGILGALPNSTGTATITGAGSRWDSDGLIDIGVGGSGTLRIENSAVATAFYISIGINSQSIGSVTVNGSGTEFRHQTIVVGQNGSATMRVEAGALVDTRFDVSMAVSSGSVADATVTGANSLWSMSGYLAVGGAGTGTFTLADGATVIVYRPPAAVPPPSEVRISPLSTMNIGTGGLGGTLQTDLLINNGTLNFNHTNAITQSVAISGAGQIVKTGSGSTILTNASSFTGSMTSSSGQLILQGALGAALYTAATGGTLRFDGSTVNMSGTSTIRSTGGAVEYSGATVNGGILRGQLPGAGTHTIVSNASNTRFNGVTIQSSVDLIQNNGTNFTNVANGGRLTSNAFLFYDGGTNTTSGNIIVNNSFNTRDFTNNGQITVNSGGSLFHRLGNLASGGGSRTTVNTGGLINLMDGSQLDLNGSLLVNNGTISGTVNVNYGSLAKGTGTYGAVNVNTGGIYAPGNSPGISTAAAVTFDNAPITSGAPTLAIELAGTTPGTLYDQLHVTGSLSLGGELAVSLINNFVPVAGQAFDILDWGGLSGTFGSINLPTLSSLTWNTSQLYVTGVLSVGLAGDYNNNGVVDAADYPVWRDGLGPTYSENDYIVWRANFGRTLASGGGAGANVAVPEPALLISLIMAAACWSLRRA